jgi:DNA-binding FadR family transcriptional regulator
MFASRHSQIYGWAEVIELHRNIVVGINAGDQAAARFAIDAHMQNSLDRALHAFSSTSASPPTYR